MSPKCCPAEVGSQWGGRTASKVTVLRGTPASSRRIQTVLWGRMREAPHPVASELYHQPALLDESLSLLELRPDAVVVDGTVGGGGHAAAILERTGPNGLLVALDVDDEALAAAGRRLAPYGSRVRLIRASFRHLRQVLAELGLERVDAVLLDLGVSSHQLDSPERGFRFAAGSADEAPLDMRMDRRLPRGAAELLNRAPTRELEEWLRRYGELPGAARLARELDAARRQRPLGRVSDLLAVIRAARVGRGRRHNPATLVFQALRIAVNDEIQALEEGLGAAIEALRPGGRLAVIAYHSVEDRVVKLRLRDEARGCVCPRGAPVCRCGRVVRVRVLTRRPLRPGAEEIRRNPRARSARLRGAERVAEAA